MSDKLVSEGQLVTTTNLFCHFPRKLKRKGQQLPRSSLAVVEFQKVHFQLTPCQFLPGSGRQLLSYSFFTLRLFPDGYGGYLCFDFPFLSKVAARSGLGGPLFLRGTVTELESCLAESACAAQPGEMCTCFRTDSPLLGPPHHHNADPCDCNVNNPAFPERRGGASVKEWRETVKYREIQRSSFTTSRCLYFESCYLRTEEKFPVSTSFSSFSLLIAAGFFKRTCRQVASAYIVGKQVCL